MDSTEIALEANTKKKTTLEVHEGLSIPLWSVGGSEPGPTLVLTAGIHGCEYVGILAARRLFEYLDPADLKGNILILPAVNEQGFYEGLKQVVPGDQNNLNRAFPGNSRGGDSEQMAYVMEKQLYPIADFLIDLHSADINERIEPLVFFSKIAEETVVAQSRAAANCMQVNYRIPSTSRNGYYSYAALQGVPGVLLEIGSQGMWTEEEVQRCVGSVRTLLAHLGMTKEDEKPAPGQQEALESVYEEALDSGLWYPQVMEGKSFKKGTVLGILEDMDGRKIQEIIARFDGMVIYYTVSLGVSKDDPLVAYCRFQ